MKRTLFIISLLLIVSLLFNSCGNSFKVDVSDVKEVKVNIDRYEIALFDHPLSDERIKALQQKYPLFLGDIPLDEKQKAQLKAYVNDPFLKDLFKKVAKLLPSLSVEEKELSESFRHIKYYYPSFNHPQVYTYLSGVQDLAFYQEGVLMVSIDHYLGKGEDLYQKLGTPMYKQYGMQKKFFVKDVLMSIAKVFVQPIAPDAKLIDQMIYEGKLLYFIKSMNPNISDEVLFTQNETHLNWLKNKESEMWRYYIENELLFKNDYLASNKFINDAPFTAVLGDGSAPRTGIWLGYQIVYSYMNHKDIDLKKLLSNANSQQILQQSKYKP